MLHSPRRAHATSLIPYFLPYFIRWSHYETDPSTHDRIISFLWNIQVLRYNEAQFRYMLNHLKVFLFNQKEATPLRLLAAQLLGMGIFYNMSTVINDSLKSDLLSTMEHLMKDSNPEVRMFLRENPVFYMFRFFFFLSR
jgi:hypothetical protein